MATPINTLLLHVLVVNVGYVVADICYTRYSFGYYSHYCSGYCSGGYGYEYCTYDTNSTVGAIAGIVIGSLIFFGVVIALFVAVCYSCMKTNGSRGRVVQTVTTPDGIAVVQSQGTMSSVEEKYFFRLIKFSYDLSLKVIRTFTKTNILHCHNSSFVEFLDVYRHELYHLWINNTRCCACSSNALVQQSRPELNKEQFIKLYDIKGTTIPGHFKKGIGKSIIQHCLCGVTCIASCSLNDLDIILIHTIIRKCVKLNPDDDMWLKTIRDIRNKLAHAVSTTDFDKGRLDKWWSKLEGSVLGLAGKVPPFDCYAASIEDQIKLLKIADLDKNGIEEIVRQIREENKKILNKQEELTGDVKQKSEEIKEEIIHRLDQNKEMLIDIKNLIFEVKTHGLQRQLPVIEDKKSMSPNQDSETCYVEWHVMTPNEWQVEQIKEKLDQCKTSLQGCFKLEFVYVGSLVMETSVQKKVLEDGNLLIPAVRSFLEKLVEVCEIDTKTTATVHISLSILRHVHKGLPSILCDLCQIQNKYISAVNWCPDCNVTLCIDCTSNHKSQQATEDHHMVDVNFKYDLQIEIENQQYCTKHAQIKVEYYCPVHDSICCGACLDDKHRSCDEVINLDAACKGVNRSLLEELGVEINNMNKSLACLEEETNKHTSDINNDSKNIEKEIVQAKAEVIDLVNENETILMSEFQTEQAEALRKQHEVKQRCQTMSENLVIRSGVMTFVKQHGTDKQAFVLVHHLKPAVENIRDSVFVIVSSATRTTLRFDKRKDLIPSFTMLGSIDKSKQPSQVKLTPTKQKFARRIVPDKPLISFKCTSKFRTSDTANVTGMIVTENNKLLLCNCTYKYEVLVYNENGQYVSAITMTDRPFDIAVIPGGDQYVVTLPYTCIQFINSKDLTPGKCVQLPAKHFIYGIAADKQHIYVGEENRIFVLNIAGIVVREIQLENYGFVTFLVVNDNSLYASDQYGSIYCIDQNETIRQTQVTDEWMIRKIIVDRQGYLYAGGQESEKVHRLDKDLKQNMTIGDDSVTKITAICFNKNCTKLFVASDWGKTIAVFSCS